MYWDAAVGWLILILLGDMVLYRLWLRLGALRAFLTGKPMPKDNRPSVIDALWDLLATWLVECVEGYKARARNRALIEELEEGPAFMRGENGAYSVREGD